AKPARVSSCAATLATMASLSTRTPLQSKMNTQGPRIAPARRALNCVPRLIRVARLWTRLQARKAKPIRQLPCAPLFHKQMRAYSQDAPAAIRRVMEHHGPESQGRFAALRFR